MAEKSAVVLISAFAEWRVVKSCFPKCSPQPSLYNEWFEQVIEGRKVIFYHGGWGKISAAATAQFAIDRWKPDLLINLGTCGGFKGCIAAGEIILAEETVVYDIVERMGDAQEALDFYTTRLDLSWLDEPLPHEVRRLRMISADRDIDPAEIRRLKVQFNAVAADWETGTIAWVAAKNHVRCLILRGVTDLVDDDGGEAYDNLPVFTSRTEGVMNRLLVNLPGWLACALKNP